MEDSGCSAVSLSSLLCTETEACLVEEEDESEFFNLSGDCSLSETHEYIKMLVDTESRFGIHGSSEDCSSTINEWLKCARLDAIKWILEKRAFFGFRFKTAYLSLNYFDRFLSKKYIDNEQSWAIGLLSIACLSIAVKMEECSIPALTEFRMEEYNFESKVIQRMELLILNTLDWRMCSITPFNYLHYFTTKISDKSRPRDLAFRAVEFIFAMAKEFGLLDYRPSAIAAAAILAALNKRLTREMIELKMSLISSCGSLHNEEVLSCYSLMQDIEIGKFEVPRYVISPDQSTIRSSCGNFIEDSAITSVVGTKRRRLKFDDSDRHSENEKDKHL